MKIARLKSNTSGQLLSAESKNFLALLQLSILGLQGFILLVLLFMGSRLSAIANRQPTFAQMVNGDTVYITEKDQLWRYPQVIKKVASDWTTLAFNWEGKITGTDEADEGIEVEGGDRVPMNTWFASVLMEPGFAKASLKEISQLDGIEQVFSGQLRSVVIISDLSEPRQIAPGKWQLDMIATRMLIDRATGKNEPIAFNRTFTLQAVEIPQSPLGTEASPVERKIYEIRSAGLEITSIEPFDPTQR